MTALRRSRTGMAICKWAATAVVLCSILPGVRASGESIDKTVLNSTVWITYQTPIGPAKDSPAGSKTSSSDSTTFGGTGFLLFHDVGYGKGSVYLVTNKHLLPKPAKQASIHIRVAVREPNGSKRVQEIEVPVARDGKYLNTVRLHPDPGTDVAAIDITSIALGSKMQLLVDAIQSHRCLDLSMLMTSERLQNSQIGPMTPVYVVGFPAALFDPRNVSPLARIGYISSEPRDGFDFNAALRRRLHLPRHLNGFLIDANVYPGASGSLVLLANGTPTSQPAASEPAILGIVGGSIPIFDESLQSYERIGLGVVYSADAISEVIQLFGNSR